MKLKIRLKIKKFTNSIAGSKYSERNEKHNQNKTKSYQLRKTISAVERTFKEST